MADDTTNDSTPSDAGNQSVIADDIRESIAIGGFTAVSGQPSSLSNLAYSNAIANNNNSQQSTIANQQAINQLTKAALGSTINLVANLSPLEAVAVVKMDTGNDAAQQLADVKGIVNAFAPPSPTPPKPPTPPPPLPTVKSNPPPGGSTVTVVAGNFPITLDIDENASKPVVKRVAQGGTIIIVNSNAFPVEFQLQGGQQDLQKGTIFNVSKAKFPIQLKLSKGGTATLVNDTLGGSAVFTVEEKKFPVQVNLAST